MSKKENDEKITLEMVVFTGLGLFCVIFCVFALYNVDAPLAATSFAMGIVSFIYANVSRFKKIKGIGFEAELWDDTKQEAERVLTQLRRFSDLYSHAMIKHSVTRMRLSDSSWEEHINLYNDLSVLARDIGSENLSKAKEVLDQYIIFDISLPALKSIDRAITKGKETARKIIFDRDGGAIKDISTYNRDMDAINSIETLSNGALERAINISYGDELISRMDNSQRKLKQLFEIEIEFDPKATNLLKYVAEISRSRPLHIDKSMVNLAEARELTTEK